MRAARWVVGIGIVGLLSGCTAAVPAEEPSPSADRAGELCREFGDVLTIVNNAGTALREERMAEQEHQGWQRLATRVLDRLDTEGAGEVGEVVGELQESVEAAPFGGGTGVPAFTSDAWWEGYQRLMDACEDAGTELASEGFTGG